MALSTLPFTDDQLRYLHYMEINGETPCYFQLHRVKRGKLDNSPIKPVYIYSLMKSFLFFGRVCSSCFSKSPIKLLNLIVQVLVG